LPVGEFIVGRDQEEPINTSILSPASCTEEIPPLTDDAMTVSVYSANEGTTGTRRKY